MTRNRLLSVAAALMFGAARMPAGAAYAWFADDPPLIGLGTGAAEIFDSHQKIYWGLEYRPAFRFHRVGPWFLFGTCRNNEFYAAIGASLNVELGWNWILTPGFGGGYYHAGNGLDLGFDNEFRTSIELAKRFRNGHRFGFTFAHISNGSLSEKNPGTETFGFVYSIPLDPVFRKIRGTSIPDPL